MKFRTDLAIEFKENINSSKLYGISQTKFCKGNLNFTSIEVENNKGAELISRPIGRYIIAETTPHLNFAEVLDDDIEHLAEVLKEFMPQNNELVLVVGLGNRNITPDAIGTFATSSVFSTRHLKKELLAEIGLDELRPVATISPGVLGQTGIEVAEIIKSVVFDIKPALVIAIDALASRSVARLGSTIQISTSGVIPGGGVKNARPALNGENLGVPVLLIGIPTVVDTSTLICDMLGDMCDDDMFKNHEQFVVTPKDIDIIISRGAKIISSALNLALNPSLSLDEVALLTS
ncbi:MAG: GPR endopeptidase [Oscillospiraceae bacterium]|nr:GPR endopeptidase [Oscillospiraceae bacterium]